MFLKRFLITTRSWIFIAIQILLPILIFNLFITRKKLEHNQLPPLRLTLNEYEKPVTVSCLLDAGTETFKYYQAYNTYVTNNFDSILETIDKDIDKYIVEKAEEDFTSYINRYIVGATFVSKEYVIAHYNGYPLHTQPLALSLVYNAILRSSHPNKEIIVINKPLPPSTQTIMEKSTAIIWLPITFSLTFSTAFFIGHPIRERIRKVKHLQIISGLKSSIFWITNFIWDFSFFLLTAIMIIVVVACYNLEGYQTVKELGTLLLTLLILGYGIIPQIYVFSYIFGSPTSGTGTMMFFNFLTGIAFYIVEIMLYLFPTTRNFSKKFKSFAYCFPLYSFVHAMVTRERLIREISSCRALCEKNDDCWQQMCTVKKYCCDKEINLFSWDHGIGREITYMLRCGTVYIILVILLQIGIVKYIFYSILKLCQKKPKDESTGINADVAEERDKINSATREEIKSYCIATRNLTKVYGLCSQLVAVNKLCVVIDPGQCFGLLGLNGAGKTTTFRMLTGDEMITSGKAWIHGIPVRTIMSRLQRLTGYCPQFDALNDNLTGRQTLRIYSMIKGYKFCDSNDIAERLAKDLDFTKHIDKRVKNYSGGNKRKLSIAIATVGFPLVIFLDEPTAGMDPATKRKTWDVLNTARDTGQSLVLTSHSMEECEALCTRVAIMVNGTFRCLGSKQHLKSTFSDGYFLTVQMSRVSEDELAKNIENAKIYILQKFPGAVLQAEYSNMLNYFIKSKMPCSAMFGIAERARHALKMDDYSIGQCTLEQVFLMITKDQTTTNTNS